jgi:tetratricopeptide (TPR) repeat protein
MLTAISIFHLKLLLTILNYLDLFNEQSIQVERLDTERKQLAEDLDLQRRLLIAMASETILESATSTLPMPELVSRGSELLRRRDYQNAIKLLTEAFNADPTSMPQVYLFRAQGYFATRNRIQAKQDIEKYDELMRRSAAE